MPFNNSRWEFVSTLPNNSSLEEGQGGVTADRRTPKKLNDRLQWQIQLHVTNGEYADHENWLGVSSAAHEEWDELEWSEPPAALGNFVALRFDRSAWQRFGGEYTTDFRPPSAAAQSWAFEIISGVEGRTVQLWLEAHGAWPRENIFVLEEEGAAAARVLAFDETTNTSTRISFRSGTASRRFVLWMGSKEQLQQQGVAALLVPARFALAPAYPNPARLHEQGDAVSAFRFSIPEASEVDLRIYDMLGRQVRGLILKQFYTPGHYEALWDGKDDSGRAVSSGVYLYHMAAANFQATQKLIVLKK